VKPGGVVVNAPSYLLFSGRGIIFAGVDFGAGCGLLSNSDILCTDYHSRYITFSHLRFNACGSTNANGEDVHWIRLRGFNNTIEYCSFTERPETSRNVTVEFMPDISEGGIDVPRNHSIRYCYFGTRYAPASASGSDSDNGFESIRIGVGDVQTFDMRVNVEKNVFYRSIWRTDGTFAGEPEIISNKSKGNTIRNNTILETQGGICLRTGQNCTVEGNFIFGNRRCVIELFHHANPVIIPPVKVKVFPTRLAVVIVPVIPAVPAFLNTPLVLVSPNTSRS
jgi:parallel beta-helix repeat protein